MDLNEHQREKKQRFIIVLHFTVTPGSSTMRITRTLNWEWTYPRSAAEWYF